MQRNYSWGGKPERHQNVMFYFLLSSTCKNLSNMWFTWIMRRPSRFGACVCKGMRHTEVRSWVSSHLYPTCAVLTTTPPNLRSPRDRDTRAVCSTWKAIHLHLLPCSGRVHGFSCWPNSLLLLPFPRRPTLCLPL